MRGNHREKVESKEIIYEELEEFAREKIRGHLQELLEQEVTEWLGREKGARKLNPNLTTAHYRKRGFGYEHYPKRSELLLPLDFDRQSLNRFSHLLQRLPTGFPILK